MSNQGAKTSEFAAAGLGHMRRNRGPSPKWKRHYGERSIRFYEEAHRVEVIPTQRAIDFILKHHLYIGALLVRGVLFKDIWLAARATNGFKVEYSTFYSVLRRFADFLNVPRRSERRRLRDEQLKELAQSFRLHAADGGAAKASAVVVDLDPTEAAPAVDTTAKPAIDNDLVARRKRLKQGVRPESSRSAQIAAELKKQI